MGTLTPAAHPGLPANRVGCAGQLRVVFEALPLEAPDGVDLPGVQIARGERLGSRGAEDGQSSTGFPEGERRAVEAGIDADREAAAGAEIVADEVRALPSRAEAQWG